jgi:hypothetical protein
LENGGRRKKTLCKNYNNIPSQEYLVCVWWWLLHLSLSLSLSQESRWREMQDEKDSSQLCCVREEMKSVWLSLQSSECRLKNTFFVLRTSLVSRSSVSLSLQNLSRVTTFFLIETHASPSPLESTTTTSPSWVKSSLTFLLWVPFLSFPMKYTHSCVSVSWMRKAREKWKWEKDKKGRRRTQRRIKPNLLSLRLPILSKLFDCLFTLKQTHKWKERMRITVKTLWSFSHVTPRLLH